MLADAAVILIRKMLLKLNIRLPYSNIKVKHFTIFANVTTQNFDEIYDGTWPDLVIVGLVADENFAGYYYRNPFNF